MSDLLDDGLDDLGFDTGLDGGGGGGADFDFLQSEIDLLNSVFTSFVVFVIGFFKLLGSFLTTLWQDYLKGVVVSIWNAFKTAWQWLEQKLQSVVAFLKKLRDLQQKYFNTYLRPILNLLQMIRGYLHVLNLFGIHIAAALDNYIAGLEARLVRAWTTMTATVNALTDIANALIDPEYLLRSPALIMSIRRAIPALSVVVTGRAIGYWFPSPKGAHSPAQTPPIFGLLPTASSYLGFSDGVPGGLSTDAPFMLGFASVDQAQPLDYFNFALYPSSPCSDPAACLARALDTLDSGVTKQSGG